MAGAQREAGGNVVRDNGRSRALPGERATEDAEGIALVRSHYEKNGIGADYIGTLFR